MWTVFQPCLDFIRNSGVSTDHPPPVAQAFVSASERVPLSDYKWTERHVFSAGLNYYPIPQIVIKADYSLRMLKTPYNNEPSLNIGVAYEGFFL